MSIENVWEMFTTISNTYNEQKGKINGSKKENFNNGAWLQVFFMDFIHGSTVQWCKRKINSRTTQTTIAKNIILLDAIIVFNI